jgi:type I restriction enzyme, S subunit
MSFPRYPKYKASGVDWLGEVPEGWVTQRLKHSSRIPIRNGLGESAESDDPTQPRYVRITDIKSPRELHESTFKSLPKETADLARFHVGDILFACVGATFGKSYLHSFDAGPMCFAGYLAKYSPKPLMDSRFISYWTESRTFWDQLQANVIQSTIQNFSAAKYRELVLVLPATAEQTAIAEFLDRETAKIDGLVAEQRRLMELLKEKRQAVISHAVTKGLNPHAPMKPSGIEWLGDVPVGWALKRLQNVCHFQSGKAHEPFICDDGIYMCVTSRFVSTEGMKCKMCSENISPARRNDTLMVMSDLPNGRALAKAYFVGDERAYAVNQRVCILRPFSVAPKFLYYLLDRNPEFLQHDDGINQTHLSNSDFLKPQFPFPPHDEQVSIAEFLDAELAKFDTLTAEAQRAIDLLQERRSALISAAVTGQIDVRA